MIRIKYFPLFSKTIDWPWCHLWEVVWSVCILLYLYVSVVSCCGGMLITNKQMGEFKMCLIVLSFFDKKLHVWWWRMLVMSQISFDCGFKGNVRGSQIVSQWLPRVTKVTSCFVGNVEGNRISRALRPDYVDAIHQLWLQTRANHDVGGSYQDYNGNHDLVLVCSGDLVKRRWWWDLFKGIVHKKFFG